MSLVNKSVLFFHGFWGQARDFDFLSSNDVNLRAIKYRPQLIEYTKEPLLGPQTYLLDWGQAFWDWSWTQQLNESIKAVGYSQGGRLLLQALAVAPEKFETLVLISVHPGLTSFQEKEQRLSHDRKWAKDFQLMNWHELQTRWNAQSVFSGGKEKPRNESEFDRSKLALCLENWSLAHQPDFRNLILEHSNKIKIVLGSEDTKYIKLYEDFGMSFEKAKGAAHRVPSDQPTILAEILNSIF